MVFITGATGLVGARLVYELHKDNSAIKALCRNSSSIEKLTKTLNLYTNNAEQIIKSIEWIEGDILDFELLFSNIEPDMDVYHCAALVSFNPKDKRRLMDINVQGTANIVNVCIEKKVRKFCHVSSIGALGTPVNGNLIDIDSPWSPVSKSAYSISKHYAELEVWRGMAEGLNAVIVNPAVILGAGDWENGSASLITRIAKGMKYFTLGSTGYVNVKDVVAIMIMLMHSNINEQQFILSAETLNYQTLFNKIASALNVVAPHKHASLAITSFAWRLEQIKVALFGGIPRITKYTHQIAHSVSNYNGEPIIEAINFNYTPIDATIEQVCKSYMGRLQE